MQSKIALAEIAQPYAEALMSVAQSNNLTEEFGSDIRILLSLLGNSQELRSFFENPFVKLDSKKALVNQIMGEGGNTYLRNFLLLLVDRRRIQILEGICQQYLSLLRQLNQTVLAQVISAVPLSDEQQETVKQKVKAMTNAREVELDTRIDREIIGGVIIKVGSQVVDASIRGQLRRLSLRLSGS
ncbi:ATP synthase F1 subunit delta [Calothrix sp. 336/3]|uniref:ATP synthase F1 subunit delta n=1 Tax=Calothrix sp. 336/3 TaxID=1337936 RepID=UPI0004E2F18C|nr:ATP synthase F1 subunit delta [Calothrix sp. 336/3]AKG23934.1 ATP synthase F0F1 subunit delta [Calothrix sp. 336/3]